MTARRVILVPHTHWDREWYFTTRTSKVLLLESLSVVLDELEAGRLPWFVLDGQTSLLEDYLLNALRQYRDGSRKDPVMTAQAALIAEEDLAKLAMYFAGLDGLETTKPE